MMIPNERRRQIMDIVEKKQTVSINELVGTLNVSHMTVRRDIAMLEESGKVIAVSGGVQCIQPLYRERTHAQKAQTEIKQKQAIGKCAAAMIPPNATIYLDAGTTCLQIAEHLDERDDLLIITNDFYIANHLIQYNRSRVYHTGGKVDVDNASCVGQAAAQMLQTVNIDMAFISTSSWNTDGISTPSEDKVIVKQMAVDSAAKAVLVSDHTKFGRVAAFNVLPLSAFTRIITDKAFDEQKAEELTAQGCALQRV